MTRWKVLYGDVTVDRQRGNPIILLDVTDGWNADLFFSSRCGMTVEQAETLIADLQAAIEQVKNKPNGLLENSDPIKRSF